MNEEHARASLNQRFGVPRETIDALERFCCLLTNEAQSQNLVATRTLNSLWSRHILDSVQLGRFAPATSKHWLDLGSGAGFPGLVIAATTSHAVTLIESRKLRAAFLAKAAGLLGISVEIQAARLENVPTSPFGVISARAFAPLPRLLALAHRFSTAETIWILPKGKGASDELEAIARTWHGDFRIEPSITDAEAGIIIATQVQPRNKP